MDLSTRGYEAMMYHAMAIEQLAAYYVQCMVDEVSDGVCYVAGHCFGGAVAYEMCHLLSQHGIHAIPIIIDTPVPQESTRVLPAVSWDDAQWVGIVGEVLARNAGKPLDLMDKMVGLTKTEALQLLKKSLVNEGLYAVDSDLAHLELIVDMLQELDLSFIHYKPNKSNRPIYLLRAKEMTAMDVLGILASGNEHSCWGWENITDTIQCHFIPGDHNTMLNADNVSEMLPFFLDCFEKNDEKILEFN